LLDVMQISEVLSVEDENTFTRPIYAGNAIATVRSSDAKKVLTVRGTAFAKAEREGGSGTIELGGNWSNSGGYIGGTATVRFRDLCAFASAAISGNSSFANARFVTSTGKNYVFAVGSTQTITGLLEITGTASHPIQFRNSVPGQVAFINLAAAGAQQIVHVGVTDVWATGQFLAPGQHNEGGGGNAKRWFGSPTPPPGEAIPVPALSDLTQGVLAALLALAAAFGLRRRTSLPVVGRIARGLRAERTRS
jgi:MYXO-CTERM domain-containing protein